MYSPDILVVPPVLVVSVIVPAEYVPPVTKLNDDVDTVPPVESPIVKVPEELVKVTPVVTGIVYELPVKMDCKSFIVVLNVQYPVPGSCTIGIMSEAVGVPKGGRALILTVVGIFYL